MMNFKRQCNFRRIFIAGHIIGIILFFLPGHYGEYTEWQVTQYLLSGADSAAGLFMLATLAARIAFLVLAIYYPQRWVFITGAAWASLILLNNFVLNGTLAPHTISHLLTVTQLLMRTTGFFAASSAYYRWR